MARSPHNDKLDELAATPAAALVSLSEVAGEHASYSWKNVVVTLWLGPSTLPALAIHDQKLEAFCAANPQGISTVNYISPDNYALPSPEVREELGRFAVKYAKHIVASATLIPGSGFWASSVRAVTTAITLVRRGKVKQQAFGTPRQLAEWLPQIHFERTGVAIDADELAAWLESAERTHATGGENT